MNSRSALDLCVPPYGENKGPVDLKAPRLFSADLGATDTEKEMTPGIRPEVIESEQAGREGGEVWKP